MPPTDIVINNLVHLFCIESGLAYSTRLQDVLRNAVANLEMPCEILAHSGIVLYRAIALNPRVPLTEQSLITHFIAALRLAFSISSDISFRLASWLVITEVKDIPVFDLACAERMILETLDWNLTLVRAEFERAIVQMRQRSLLLQQRLIESENYEAIVINQ